MKKNIAAAAILAVSFISFSALAQTSQPENCPAKARTECRKAPRQMCDSLAPDPFAGLTLTEAQRAQLTELRKKQAESNKLERAKSKERRMEQGAEAKAKRSEAKRNYLDQVKAIVGPEQYVVFLENFYLNTPAKPKMGQTNNRKRADDNHGKDVKYKMPRRQNEADNK
ncbi:MAG: hypothetical protein NC418_05820 [Muribaculaceae bacterium]|nr:hypothetical protein [Muribaculaceae bacterium]